MEFLSQFGRGLNNEFKPVAQPQGTYIDMLNGIRKVDGTPFAEGGTELIANLPEGLNVIGSTVLENDCIVLLTDGTTHEIGIIDKNNTYTQKVNDTTLNFNLGFPIDIQARKNFKGDRIIYFTDNGYNPPRIINLDDVNLEDLNLFLTYNIPTVSVTSVNEDGNLATGIYQFAARLLTGSTNATAFGFISNPVPITDKAKASGRDNYDGALPQTAASKSISLTVDNIDQNFDFLEIAALTYNGLSNQFSGNIIARIPIQGRSSIDFRYSSETDHRYEITLDELVQEFPNYIGAKCIEQKDGRLFLSNLKAADLNIDFQEVANNITLKYEVEEVEVPLETINLKYRRHGGPDGSDNGTDTGGSTNSYNDYKDELVAHEKKSYRREEVYSFAIVPILDGSIIGPAFHIPGNNRTTTSTTEANTTTKILGTYVSASEYPAEFGYPTGNVRHHKFPSIKDEPHFSNDGDTYYIRILKLKVEDVDLSLLGDDADRVTGYVIVRQPRNDEFKSVVSQGIAQTLQSSDAEAPYSNFYLTPVTGKPGWFDSTTDGTPLPQSTTQTAAEGANLIGFLSPETTLLQKSFTATHIAAVATVTGIHHATSHRLNADAGKNDNYWHSLLNYSNLTTLSSISKKAIDTSTIQYVPADNETGQEGSFYNANNVPITIWTDANNGFLFFKLSTDTLPVNNPLLDGRPEFMYEDAVGDGDYVYLHDITSTGSYHHDESPVENEANETIQGATNRYLFNLYNNQPNQYGEVYDARYMFVGYTDSNLETAKTFYGGDTFIGKIALDSKTRRRATSGVDVVLQERYYTTNYVFVESEVNVNYRHYITPTGQNSIGTIPYYPKNKIFDKGDGTGMNELPASYGHSTGYNKQYSFENTLKYYFPKQLAQESITEFENRTIYSEQSIEGEQFDAYRLILPNNYHDIPKNKGEIIDTFVFNNSFYIHTSQSLWKASVNERTAITTDTGQLTTGNGGLFPTPSVEIFTVNGGYGGTQSQFAGCNTPYGRFFIDNIQGKVFMLTDQLEEISNPDMFNYFLGIIKPVLVDAPAINQGWISVYDYSHKRWLLTNTTLGLKPEYWSRYKGVWNENDSDFLASLVSGNSIVLKDGIFQIYNSQ